MIEPAFNFELELNSRESFELHASHVMRIYLPIFQSKALDFDDLPVWLGTDVSL